MSATARHVFGDRFDYVYALHTDRPHPNVHLTVRTVGHDGRALRINKDDLVYLRRALALRMRGVEADATPQVARGRRVKHDRTEVHRARQRRATTEHLVTGDATAEARAGAPDPYVRRVYEAAARRLRTNGQDGDDELAARIERFTAARLAQPPSPGHIQDRSRLADKPATDGADERRPRAPKPRL